MAESDVSLKVEPHRYLSAPWRGNYVQSGQRIVECVFCAKALAIEDEDNLVLCRADSFFIIMNLYPYTTGHIMIAPYAHVPSPEELDPSVMSEMSLAIAPSMRALRRVLKCQGFNVGINTGSVAGAGVADHLHVHIVPRWSGDANFMPVLADTTVMPEALSRTYDRLKPELLAELRSDKSIP